MPTWWGRKEITARIQPSERRLLDLVVAGENDFLARLQAQVAAPDLLLYAQRRRSPTEYHLVFVIDGNKCIEYAATGQVSVMFADLCVKVEGVSSVLRVEAWLVTGILGRLRLHPHAGTVKWPRILTVTEWGYLASEEWDGSMRPDTVRRTLPDALPPGVTGPEPSWASSLDFRDSLLSPGASADAIAALRETVGDLPKDYEQFLRWTDGALFGRWGVCGTDDAYLLDDSVTDRRMLVISSVRDTGDVIALDLDTGAVYEFTHDPFEHTRIAPSLTRWLKTITTEE